MPPWLTVDEIADLCEGLTQSAAQKRYLARLGLPVREKPNGRPLVMRADVERLGMASTPAAPKRGPNRAGLIALVTRPG